MLRTLATAAITCLAVVLPTMPAAAQSCQYKVIWSVAGVYEKPSNASTKLKTKQAGDIVGGYCDWTYYNTTEMEEYLAVATDSAEDGIGWMRRDAVTKI